MKKATTVGEYYKQVLSFLPNLPSIEEYGYRRTPEGIAEARKQESEKYCLHQTPLVSCCGMECKKVIDAFVPFAQIVKDEHRSAEECFSLVHSLLQYMSVSVYG